MPSLRSPHPLFSLLSLSLFLSLFTPNTSASPHNLTAPFLPLQDSHRQMKRWYSVDGADDGTAKGGWGPWPVMCEGPEQLQPVRYCFGDERSAGKLQGVVDQVSFVSE